MDRCPENIGVAFFNHNLLNMSLNMSVNRKWSFFPGIKFDVLVLTSAGFISYEPQGYGRSAECAVTKS